MRYVLGESNVAEVSQRFLRYVREAWMKLLRFSYVVTKLNNRMLAYLL
jgi:hypothetical protein